MFGRLGRAALALGVVLAALVMPQLDVSGADASTSAFTGVERTLFTMSASTPIPGSIVARPPGSAPPATTIQSTPAAYTPTGSARIFGMKSAGSAVTISLASGSTVCTVPADQSTSWDCGIVELPDGSRVRLDAVETPTAPLAVVPASGSITLDSLAPPTLDGPTPRLTTGIVSGTGRPGARVAVSVDGVPDASCGAVTVGPDSSWSCNLASTGGVPQLVRAQQSDAAIGDGSPTAYSNAITVTIDRLPAPAPGIDSPASAVAGRDLVVTGSGEDAASIDLYLDNVPVCSTTVVGSAWTCVISAVPPGTHDLQAVQRDEAGNFSPPSTVVQVQVGTSAASGPLTPSPPPSDIPSTTPSPMDPRTNPAPPGRATPATPGPDAEQPGAQQPDAQQPDAQQPDPSGAPPTLTAPPPLSPPASNWGAPTKFGSTLTSFVNPASFSSWYTAPLIALVFLSLIALPLRLLASTLHDRLPARRPQVTGRNRFASRTTTDEAVQPVPALWRRMLLPLGATAALVIFTGGIDGEVRYARLFIAVAIGLTVLNIVGGGLGARLGAVLSGHPTVLRFAPLMFVAAAGTAILSRILNMDPPLVAGILVAPAFAIQVAARGRATVNLVQVASVLALGVLGWIGHSALAGTGLTAAATSSAATSSVGGLWMAIASESLATLCLAGLGSALVMVLPIASLPGRVVLEWSAAAWVATVLVVASVAAGIIVSAELATSVVPLILGAITFAVVSVAVWAWVRYVEPSLA